MDAVSPGLENPTTADAYVIRGNPDVDTEHAGEYDKFYDDVKRHLESKGLTAEIDPGLPETQPPGGKYWIGHSRGADRLRFAPDGVKTLRLDDYEPAETRAQQQAEYQKLFQQLGVGDVVDIPLDQRPHIAEDLVAYEILGEPIFFKIVQTFVDMYKTKYVGWESIPDIVAVGLDNGTDGRPYSKEQILDEMRDPGRWEGD